jgi:hypothetical protein
VHHQFDDVTLARAPGEPDTEPEVDRSISVAVGHPLHQQATRRRKCVERFRQPSEIRGTESTGLGMNLNGRRCSRGRRRRTPDVNLCAITREGLRDLPCVVADTTNVGRILTRENVPARHHCAPCVATSTDRLGQRDDTAASYCARHRLTTAGQVKRSST